MRQRPGIRMQDYDLKLLFTVKTKWKVRMLHLTHSSAIFRKGEWKAGLRGPHAKDADIWRWLRWQLWKVSSCIYTVRLRQLSETREHKREMLMIAPVCCCNGPANWFLQSFFPYVGLVWPQTFLWASACCPPVCVVDSSWLCSGRGGCHGQQQTGGAHRQSLSCIRDILLKMRK